MQLTNMVLESWKPEKGNHYQIAQKINPCACVRLFLLLHLHDFYFSRNEKKIHEKFGLCGSRTTQCTPTSAYCICAHIRAHIYLCMPPCAHKMSGGG